MSFCGKREIVEKGRYIWNFPIVNRSYISFCVFCVLSTEDRSPKTSRRKSKVLSAKYSSRRASISLAGDVEKCQYTGSRVNRLIPEARPIQNALNCDCYRRNRSFVRDECQVFKVSLLSLAPIVTRGCSITRRASREWNEKIEDRTRDQSTTYRRIVNKGSVLIPHCESALSSDNVCTLADEREWVFKFSINP